MYLLFSKNEDVFQIIGAWGVMKEQQERIKIKDSWLITIVALITVILMWIGLSAEEGEKIPMLVFFALFDIPLMLWTLKSVTLSKDGCKISYLFWKREYKWEELEIVREDRFHSYRDTNSRGIFFQREKRIKRDIHIKHVKLLTRVIL